jgi:hypothetical protein
MRRHVILGGVLDDMIDKSDAVFLDPIDEVEPIKNLELVHRRELCLLPCRQQGAVNDILLLEISKAGPLVRTRVDGILDGIKEVFPAAKKCRIVRVDAKGEFRAALDCARKYLCDSSVRNTLVGRPTIRAPWVRFECSKSADAAPASFTIHQLVTPENVNRLYPNDTLFVRLAQEYA